MKFYFLCLISDYDERPPVIYPFGIPLLVCFSLHRKGIWHYSLTKARRVILRFPFLPLMWICFPDVFCFDWQLHVSISTVFPDGAARLRNTCVGDEVSKPTDVFALFSRLVFYVGGLMLRWLVKLSNIGGSRLEVREKARERRRNNRKSFNWKFNLIVKDLCNEERHNWTCHYGEVQTMFLCLVMFGKYDYKQM